MTNSDNKNNKRIAKNTLLLYLRMLLTMGVSLYTVRIVLNTLGVVDYGLNNVVGGIVVMFSVFSNTMATASQRFFAFEIGHKNYDQLKKTFSMTMIIYLMIAVLILLLAETIGLWFLNTRMTIPPERMEAAQWVYQFSVLSFMMTMFTIPYNAAIIAHERMNMYAYVSIIEVTLKLIVVYILVLVTYDKLKLYAVLTFGVTSIITFIYRTYCIRNFSECKLSVYWNAKLFKELINYSGWSLFGSLSGIFRNQGINILLNVFYGPVVNAARGIAYQVNNAINKFASNFMIATNPQIIKYYANGEHRQMLKLVFQSSKLSFLMLFLLSMPVLLETNFILSLWLKDVPEYTILFSRLVIITALIDSLSLPLMSAAQATGNIKKYQIIVGSTQILNLPISYLFLKFNYPPQITMYIAIFLAIVCLFLRLYMLRELIKLSIKNYYSAVIIPIILTTIISYILPFITIQSIDSSFSRFTFITIISILSGLLTIFFIGITKDERIYIINFIRNKINNYGNRQK